MYVIFIYIFFLQYKHNILSYFLIKKIKRKKKTSLFQLANREVNTIFGKRRQNNITILSRAIVIRKFEIVYFLHKS